MNGKERADSAKRLVAATRDCSRQTSALQPKRSRAPSSSPQCHTEPGATRPHSAVNTTPRWKPPNEPASNGLSVRRRQYPHRQRSGARRLATYLVREMGTERRQTSTSQIFERLRTELGYSDYLGASPAYRMAHPHDPHLLGVSSFLVNYPFANRLYPGSLDAIEHVAASVERSFSRMATSSSSPERSSAPGCSRP